MGLPNMAILLLFLVLVLVYSEQNSASRVLYDHEGLIKEKKGPGLGLGFQSLPRGPVPPSGPSGCTYIPGSGGQKCPPLGEKHYVGDSLFRHESAYPRLMIQLGVATKQK